MRIINRLQNPCDARLLLCLILMLNVNSPKQCIVKIGPSLLHSLRPVQQQDVACGHVGHVSYLTWTGKRMFGDAADNLQRGLRVTEQILFCWSSPAEAEEKYLCFFLFLCFSSYLT